MKVQSKKSKRVIKGVVLSAKQDKTVVVGVDRLKKHALYGKSFKITKKYYAHDAKKQASKGDKVEISEIRPLSKLKRWQLVKVVKG